MESIQFKKEFGMEHQMRKAHSFLPFAIIVVVLLCGLSRNNVSAERRINSNNPRCNGSIAECQEELELVMDSDVHARLLQQQTKPITLGAIAQDGATCNNGNGKNYNGCSGKASAIYTRPCNEANRCERHPAGQ